MSRLASETGQVLSDLAAAQELLQADKEQLDRERRCGWTASLPGGRTSGTHISVTGCFSCGSRAFEAEKEGMMSLRAAQSDVIELNVGGTRLATKRSVPGRCMHGRLYAEQPPLRGALKTRAYLPFPCSVSV